MAVTTTSDLLNKSMRTDNINIQQFAGNINANSSTKLVKLVVPQSTTSSSSSSSSSIKMLSNGDGLASALRIPTKIQLTKTLLASSEKNNTNSSLISSTLTNGISQEQLTLSPSLTATLFDVSADLIEKQQQSIADNQSSTTLPPTPPPPVVDNTTKNNRNALDSQKEERQKKNEISSTVIKGRRKRQFFCFDESNYFSFHCVKKKR